MVCKALKARIPPTIRKFCGRLFYLGCALFGLYTCVNVLNGFFASYTLRIGTYGFWPVPPTTTIPFSGVLNGRCVSLFQGASVLTQKFPDTIFLYSYYNAYAFMGVCTRASIEDVDSIFGHENRMFKTRIPDISEGSPERKFLVFGDKPGLFKTGLLNSDIDGICTRGVDTKSCCATSSGSSRDYSGACAAAFTDVVPQGFNSVSFWKSYIGLKANLFGAGAFDPCKDCGMYVSNSEAPLCNSKAGFYPVFYMSSSLPLFYYSHWAVLLQILQILVEVMLLVSVLAKKVHVRNLVSGSFCPFFFVMFTWFPCSPLYIDTGIEDNLDAPDDPEEASQRFAWGVYILEVMNGFFSGIVYTGLQLSGGCSSFPGQLMVVALLIFNIGKFIYKFCCWKFFLKQGSGPLKDYLLSD